MKSRNKILAALFALFVYTCVTPVPVMAQGGNVSLQVFYDQLSPYGQWTNNSDYGYIWIPDVGPDFSPYSTNGYWVMTDFGWTWVSDFEWGWAPFHYGRWDYNNNYGWFWIPDTEWGPSWVIWRRGNGYYGWEPMRPGISISMSFGRDYQNVDRWHFVRDRDFGNRDLGRYYVNRSDNDMIIRNSTVINNTYVDNSRHMTYIAGPRGDDVLKFTGRKISKVIIRDNDKPGQRLSNDQLQIYRPQVVRNNAAGRRPAPSRIVDVKDVRPPAGRNNNNGRGNIPQQQQQQQKQQDQQKQQLQQKQLQQQQQTESKKQDQQKLQLQQKQQQQQQTQQDQQKQQLQQKQQQQQQTQQDQQKQQLQQQQQQQQQLQQQQQQDKQKQQQTDIKKQDTQQKEVQPPKQNARQTRQAARANKSKKSEKDKAKNNTEKPNN